jgi:hypothetical protein
MSIYIEAYNNNNNNSRLFIGRNQIHALHVLSQFNPTDIQLILLWVKLYNNRLQIITKSKYNC